MILQINRSSVGIQKFDEAVFTRSDFVKDNRAHRRTQGRHSEPHAEHHVRTVGGCLVHFGRENVCASMQITPLDREYGRLVHRISHRFARQRLRFNQAPWHPRTADLAAVQVINRAVIHNLIYRDFYCLRITREGELLTEVIRHDPFL